MNRSRLLAMCVVPLMLSQYAHGADAESTKGPLTAAEKAQCSVQRSEYNDSVGVYNAELDALKALGDEIDALSAALKQEQAAVDRRDKTAMQALNARIGKNNELVEQYEQKSASVKTMASEQTLRAAQFSEACENRPPAMAASAKTPSTDSTCSTTMSAKDVKRQIEASFVEMRADEKRHEAEVDRVAQARAKAQSWSADKLSKTWLQILGSPRFVAFEHEKRPYGQELLYLGSSTPKNSREECNRVQRIAATLRAIEAINVRQYAYMADEFRVAK
ncbi:MAG: hypothetical protein ACJ8GW_01560 [Massilia sp.]